MATHDYVIDNQSAPALRADLNSVLQAIVTQNSNATAPTTTFANMLWYDTTNKQLKKRNEANSAWITLGTIDEGAGTFTASGQVPIATQAEAEAGTSNTVLMSPLRVEQAITSNIATTAQAQAGTNNTTLMTPLRTAEAISALGSSVLLGTLAMTSGSTRTLSGLDLTPYRFLYISIDGVSTTNANYGLAFTSATGPTLSGSLSSTSSTWRGVCWITLATGTYSSCVAVVTSGSSEGSASAIYGGNSSITTADTSITFATPSGTFDAGNIRIFGVK